MMEKKLFDMSLVERMSRGDKTIITKMAGTFAGHVPAVIQQMEQAYQIGNLAELKRITHQIKPTLAIYAIVTVEKDIRQIEKAEEEHLRMLGAAIQRIGSTVHTVVEELKTTFPIS